MTHFYTTLKSCGRSLQSVFQCRFQSHVKTQVKVCAILICKNLDCIFALETSPLINLIT